ncbi:hypothetical protein HZS_5024 [Henneguya salminicola]|nr:hypothetical protein HZS_5024 [Henneguya salminicola]
MEPIRKNSFLFCDESIAINYLIEKEVYSNLIRVLFVEIQKCTKTDCRHSVNIIDKTFFKFSKLPMVQIF